MLRTSYTRSSEAWKYIRWSQFSWTWDFLVGKTCVDTPWCTGSWEGMGGVCEKDHHYFEVNIGSETHLDVVPKWRRLSWMVFLRSDFSIKCLAEKRQSADPGKNVLDATLRI